MSLFDDPEILRSVLEDLPTGVYLVGRDGKILFWNSRAERITGHLRQDVVGRFLPVTMPMGATAAKAEGTVKERMRLAEGVLCESVTLGGNRMVVWDD